MAFRNAIFAGGGSRCFWQLGFWEGAIQAGLGLQDSLRFVGSTSAGCAMATAAVLDRSIVALDLFKDMTRSNPSNVHWRNLSPFRNAPLLPHARMYREALEVFVRPDDLATLKRIPVHFLMSGSPAWLKGRASTVLGFSIYALEQAFRDPIHPQWPKRAGYRPIVGRTADCATRDEFVDLIMAASCIPPVLPGGKHREEAVLDGGLIDNVPTLLTEDQPGETLVLMSQRYERGLPEKPATTYVQPSRVIKIDKFDYANPDGLQETFDLGLQDGAEFATKRRDERATASRGYS
ncbi:MAG: patatin-like phospholipase family protein [Polyangiales bacterium]